MTDPDVSDYSDAQLEAMVVAGALSNAKTIGAAKAELTKRQRRHELERDEAQREHENTLFDAESRNQVHRKAFDERLASENRAHSEKIAQQQLEPARRSASASKWAAGAAIASAIAAMVSAYVGYMTYKHQPREPHIQSSPAEIVRAPVATP